MFLEAFHRVLKIVYLHHKQNRRVDSLLVALIKIARNTAFERMRKLEMGKNSHRICEIMKRHQSANKLSSTLITPINNKKWKVNSQNVQDIHYVVEKLEESCDCKVICHDCQICPHAYTCTCLDATLHATICKHVHLVHMNTSDHFFSNERTSSDTDYLYISNVLSSKRKKTDLETAKESLLLKVHSLEMAIRESNTVNALQAVNKHVQAAIAMLEALKEDSDKILPVKRKILPNANSERQTTFFSTKKQRQTPPTLSKPSRQDSNLCKSKIAEEEPLFCSACFKENDSNHTNVEVSWIQCDICSMWLHLSCTLPKLTHSPVNYTCHFCN